MKRILAIDGGGLRGVLSAAILERIEQIAGRPAGELFDCFYGTSTGAILAAGLASGLSAAQLKTFYLEKGATIFQKLPFYSIIRRTLYWTYAKEPLEQELKQTFGEETRLFDLPRFLSIQSKDTETGTEMFFNNFPGTQAQWRDRNLPLWQIIRASTAAPTFFQSEANRFIDGGISAYNNPSYAAFIGATRYLGWPEGRDRLRIYSIGTGYHPPLIPKGTLSQKTKLHLAAYMIEELMDDINLLQNQIMHRLQEEGRCWYKRYTIKFDSRSFAQFKIPTEGVDFEALSRMDGVTYLQELAAIGARVAEVLVQKTDLLDQED